MKTIKFIFLLNILLFFSCDDITQSDSAKVVSTFSLMINFEGADVFKILEQFPKDQKPSLVYDDRFGGELFFSKHVSFNYSVEKLTGDKEVSLFTAGWMDPSRFPAFFENNDLDPANHRCLLHFEFLDWSVWESGPEREEVYLLTFQSEEVFGNTDSHKIKLKIHVYGMAQYEFIKCEVDGEDIPIELTTQRYYDFPPYKRTEIYSYLTVKVN